MLKTISRIIWLCILCAGCVGCVENMREKAVDPQSSPVHELNKDGFDEICSRISKLNMTIVAPGSGVTHSDLPFMKIISDKYNINITPQAIENKNYYHCSDTTENRLKAFEEAINSKYDIIWAIRGGFGSNMLISGLSKLPTSKIKKKTFVGFSDITSLHLFTSKRWGWKCIHAPVLIHLSDDVYTREKFETLLDILEGKITRYNISNVHPINLQARKTRIVKGRLTGGNLTIVEASIGTCWEIDTSGKILFFEDVDVVPWRIYRSMYHLIECGKLKNIKAVIFGRFVKAGNQKEVIKFLCKIAELIDAPVYVTDDFGHGNNNMPLVYGAMATIHGNIMSINLQDCDPYGS